MERNRHYWLDKLIVGTIVLVMTLGAVAIGLRYIPVHEALITQKTVQIEAPRELNPTGHSNGGPLRPAVHVKSPEDVVPVSFDRCNNSDSDIFIKGTFTWNLKGSNPASYPETIVPSSPPFEEAPGCNSGIRFNFPIDPAVYAALQDLASYGQRVSTWEITGTSHTVNPTANRSNWNTEIFTIVYDG
jgi:hypothetical protein